MMQLYLDGPKDKFYTFFTSSNKKENKNITTGNIIPDDMNFVREDSCAQHVFSHYNIPQYHIKNRIKGHNYHHPLKRTNTEATRDDSVFQSYAEKSTNAMNRFLKNLKNE